MVGVFDYVCKEERLDYNRTVRVMEPRSEAEYRDLRRTLRDLDDLLDFYNVDNPKKVTAMQLLDRREHNKAVRLITEHGGDKHKYTKFKG